MAPNKSQFNRCSVAPLPGTTPFFAGPAQRGAGRASDWGGRCAAARDADVVPGTALVRLAYQGFGRNHQASTRRNPNVDPVQRERVNGAKADAYFGISAPNRHGGECTKPSRWGVNAAAKCGRLMEHWIRLHWFELSALALLGLNLWFVIKVSSVLRAVQDSLILLARWLDIARSEIDRQPDSRSDGRKH